MNPSRILAFLSVALLAACAVESEPNDPTELAEEALRAKRTCPQKKSEASCLAAAGGTCAWGDKGNGSECFYVGRIVPHPGSAGPSSPTVCTHNATEASCLADVGCAWGDKGNGSECFYVGNIVPHPGSSSGGAGPSSPTVCTHNTNEASCLADVGCAWGDRGNGSECFYVGNIVPHPGSSSGNAGPSSPSSPTVCTHNASEASCLADVGCAWGDRGNGSECFYVGEIIPFAR